MFNNPIYVTKPDPPPIDEYMNLLELIWDKKRNGDRTRNLFPILKRLIVTLVLAPWTVSF